MNPEQQRIAIGEACGHSRQEAGSPWLDCPDGGQIHIDDLPDYLNDLNAMHEVESFLMDNDPHTYGCYGCNLYEEYGNTVHLTAAERAEAFLRTLDLWLGDCEEAIIDPRGHEERSTM